MAEICGKARIDHLPRYQGGILLDAPRMMLSANMIPIANYHAIYYTLLVQYIHLF
jgi:hypothetical protein